MATTGRNTDVIPASARTVEVRPEGSITRPDIDPLVIIEQRNKLLERVLEVAIRSTHAGQWVSQGDKPWPTAPAAEVMARRCAVAVSDLAKEKIVSADDKGTYYLWLYECTATLPGGWDSMRAIGTCSSRDTFLGTETKEGRPLSEIDEGNIMKAAYSNMLVNAVTRLLGVRNLTWERLESLGIRRGETQQVSYRSGSKGGGSSADASLGEIKFGRAKGKTIPELTDEDLKWYRGAFDRDLKDPEKSKYHAKTQAQLAAIDAEIGRRANAKSGTAGPEQTASAYQRILAIGAQMGMSKEDIHAEIKNVTKKDSAGQLTDADVMLFQEAMKQADAGLSF
jgi:hypothetical protein